MMGQYGTDDLGGLAISSRRFSRYNFDTIKIYRPKHNNTLRGLQECLKRLKSQRDLAPKVLFVKGSACLPRGDGLRTITFCLRSRLLSTIAGLLGIVEWHTSMLQTIAFSTLLLISDPISKPQYSCHSNRAVSKREFLHCSVAALTPVTQI
jgi:hypothetical protein